MDGIYINKSTLGTNQIVRKTRAQFQNKNEQKPKPILFSISQITKWIQNDGESMLKKYTEVPLDSEQSIKDSENEFEKFYFISMVSV